MWGPHMEARYDYRYYRYECIDVTFCLYTLVHQIRGCENERIWLQKFY